jgi:hypothetical protein
MKLHFDASQDCRSKRSARWRDDSSQPGASRYVTRTFDPARFVERFRDGLTVRQKTASLSAAV